MQGSKRSLTEGSIKKGLMLFALPMFLSSLFQQLYNTADTVIVGHFLPEALASVSTSGNLVFLLVGFFHGMSVGAGVVVAKYFGAKEHENMRKAIHTNLAFGIVAGLLLSIIGALCTPAILRLLKTPEEIMPYSVEYFRTYFGGVFTVVLYNICVGILQAVGDSKHPLYYLIFSSVLNVALDLLFIGAFHWGVWSAGLATVISQGVSAVLCFARLLRVKEVYRVSLKEIKFHRGMLSKIVRFGLPSGVQNSVIAIANLFVQSNVNTFDETVISGVGCYSKVEGFAFLPITCFSMAITTFIGQNLGAKQYDRAKQGARFGILCSVILAEVVGVILFFGAPFFISLFTSDQGVIASGARQCKTEALFYFLLAFSHCIAGVCRGSGKPNVPMYVMLGCWCVIRVIVLSIALAIKHDILFVFCVYPATWLLSSICFLCFYFGYDWLHAFDKKAGDGASLPSETAVKNVTEAGDGEEKSET